MKLTISKNHIAALSLMALSATSQAGVIFTDTFDSGTGAWYIGSTVNQGGDSTLSNASGQLQFNLAAAQNKDEIIGRSFATTTIAVGETIQMTFDYRQTSSAVILRAGLFDLTRVAGALSADGWAYANSGGTVVADTYQGYSTFFRDNNNAGNVARAENSNFTTGDTTGFPTSSSGLTTITNPANTQQFDINDDGTITYQGLFKITRTATGVETLFSLSSGVTTHLSVSGVHTTATPFTSFDTAILRADNGTALFDNIQVSVIPEPSTALLGGLGLLVLLRRRRA